MTIKEYLRQHPYAYRGNTFEKAPVNYVVTWRIPKKESLKANKPVIREQRVWGYETLKEAEATARKVSSWGGSRVRIHQISHKKGKRKP